MEKIRSKYSNPDFRFARFRLGSVDFGIDIRNVKEMLSNSEVMQSTGLPGFVDGSVSLRGMSIPVVDLRRRFSLVRQATASEKVMIVVIESSAGAGAQNNGGIIAGLLIDEIKEIAMGCKEAVIKTKSKLKLPWDGCVDAVVKTGSGSVFVMDLSSLLTVAEVQALRSPVFGTNV